MSYPFLKGHGTENDFVLLPDHDGTVHGDLTARAGPRAVRPPGRHRRRRRAPGHPAPSAVGGPDGRAPRWSTSRAATPEWFMDYRNADGSLAEMCGNGVRVFARYLRRRERLVPADDAADRAPAPASRR